MEEDILLELIKNTDCDISRYINLISECPLIQDKLCLELYSDKIQSIIKENLKDISIKLIETIKLINNTEFTKHISDLNEDEKKKISKRTKIYFKI